MYIEYLHQRRNRHEKEILLPRGKRTDTHRFRSSAVCAKKMHRKTSPSSLFRRKDPACPKPRYNQVLVIWKILSRTMTGGRFPGLRLPTLPPSRLLSDCVAAWQCHSEYSDEIAQASHLFPFYPLPPNPAAKAPTAVFNSEILYPYSFISVKQKALYMKATDHLTCKKQHVFTTAPPPKIPHIFYNAITTYLIY